MSEDWGFQLSIKINGNHLVNIRGKDEKEFASRLAYAVQNAGQIQVACDSIQGETPVPIQTNGFKAPTITSAPFDIGPLAIEMVKATSEKRDGTPMDSPRYDVKLVNGAFYSTFDKLVGQAAKTLWQMDKKVYLKVKINEKNPKYKNIIEVRSAEPLEGAP